MQRIRRETASADLFGIGKHGFTGGDPVTQTPATIVTAEWLNAIQEELARAVEGSGTALDPNNHGQLAQMLAPLTSRGERVDEIDPFSGFNSLAHGAAAVNAYGWRAQPFNVAPVEMRGHLVTYDPGSIYTLPLRMPPGGRLREVRVQYNCGTTDATAEQQAQLILHRIARVEDADYLQPPALAEVSGANAVLRTAHQHGQVLTTGTIDEEIDPTTRAYRLTIIASSGNAGSRPDAIYRIQVRRSNAPP